MANFDLDKIRNAISRTAQDEAELSPQAAEEIAMHLTDWAKDLAALHAFFADPDAHTAAEIDKLLLSFLAHAPNHLAAAAKLYMDLPVSDVFRVGAVLPSTVDDETDE